MEYGKNGIVINNELELLVGIVQSSLSERHAYELVCHQDLEIHASNEALIGTLDNEQFAVCISTRSMQRLAFAIYVDGVAIRSENGTFRLSDVKDEESYTQHRRNLMVSKLSSPFEKVYQHTYLTADEKNPTLVFTHDKNESLNLNVSGQPHKTGLVEVFVWVETPKPLPPPNLSVLDTNNWRGGELSRGIGGSTDTNERSLSSKSYVGVGEDTNTKYSQTSDLYLPKYVGKAMFIHQNTAFIEKDYPTRIIHKPSARIARTDFSKYL
jgi:hypothetical protein